MAIGAFFDLDGTLVKGTSGVRFARFLIRRKILRAKVSIFIPALKTMYNIIHGNVYRYMDLIDDILAISLKGIKQSVIKKQAKQYAHLELHYLYKKMDRIIKRHKKEGHKIFLLSASPHELVSEVGKVFGFDDSYGTHFEVKNGMYTGEVESPKLIGRERVKVLKLLARKHGIDISKSYAYGNCINDLHVLESVAHPVAVNPNIFLKPIAKERHWKII